MIIEYSTTVQMNTLLALKVNTTTFNTESALNQNLMRLNDLDISYINGLQNALDVYTSGIAGLNISFNNLGNRCYTKPFVDAMVARKQDTRTNGSLNIVSVNILQHTITCIINVWDQKSNISKSSDVGQQLDGSNAHIVQ